MLPGSKLSYSLVVLPDFITFADPVLPDPAEPWLPPNGVVVFFELSVRAAATCPRVASAPTLERGEAVPFGPASPTPPEAAAPEPPPSANARDSGAAVKAIASASAPALVRKVLFNIE
jgi:hypothetical protein